MTAGTLGHGVPVLPTVSRPFGPLREVSVPLCGPACRAPVPSVGHAEGARATVARDDCLADGGWQKTRTGTWLGDQPAARQQIGIAYRSPCHLMTPDQAQVNLQMAPSDVCVCVNASGLPGCLPPAPGRATGNAWL
jgi:hypothetical protein